MPLDNAEQHVHTTADPFPYGRTVLRNLGIGLVLLFPNGVGVRHRSGVTHGLFIGGLAPSVSRLAHFSGAVFAVRDGRNRCSRPREVAGAVITRERSRRRRQ